jgi:hypothetical protein
MNIRNRPTIARGAKCAPTILLRTVERIAHEFRSEPAHVARLFGRPRQGAHDLRLAHHNAFAGGFVSERLLKQWRPFPRDAACFYFAANVIGDLIITALGEDAPPGHAQSTLQTRRGSNSKPSSRAPPVWIKFFVVHEYRFRGDCRRFWLGGDAGLDWPYLRGRLAPDRLSDRL